MIKSIAVRLKRRHKRQRTVQASSEVRLAAARHAADELHALTGWEHSGLFEQTLEDTCTTHGRFCCAQCFA
jgi:hypothetical protein